MTLSIRSHSYTTDSGLNMNTTDREPYMNLLIRSHCYTTESSLYKNLSVACPLGHILILLTVA